MPVSDNVRASRSRRAGNTAARQEGTAAEVAANTNNAAAGPAVGAEALAGASEQNVVEVGTNTTIDDTKVEVVGQEVEFKEVTMMHNATQGLCSVFFGDFTPVGRNDAHNSAGGRDNPATQLAKMRAEMFKLVLLQSNPIKMTGDSTPTDKWLMGLMRFTPQFDYAGAQINTTNGQSMVLLAPQIYFEMYSGDHMNDSAHLPFGGRVHTTLPVYQYLTTLGVRGSSIRRTRHSLETGLVLDMLRNDLPRSNTIWGHSAEGGAEYVRVAISSLANVDGKVRTAWSTADLSRVGKEFAEFSTHLQGLRDNNTLSIRYAENKPTDDRCGGHPHSQHGSREIHGAMCQGNNPFWRMLGSGGGGGKIKSAAQLASSLDNLSTWLRTANLTDMYGMRASIKYHEDSLQGMQPQALTDLAYDIAVAATGALVPYIGYTDTINALSHLTGPHYAKYMQLLRAGGTMLGSEYKDLSDFPKTNTGQLLELHTGYISQKMKENKEVAETASRHYGNLLEILSDSLLYKYASGLRNWKASDGTIPLVLNGTVNMHAVALLNMSVQTMEYLRYNYVRNVLRVDNISNNQKRITNPAEFLHVSMAKGTHSIIPGTINSLMLLRNAAWLVFVTSKFKTWDNYLNAIASDMKFRVYPHSFDQTAFKNDIVHAAHITHQSIQSSGVCYLPHMRNRDFTTWLFAPVVPLLYNEMLDADKNASKNTLNKNTELYKALSGMRAVLPTGMYGV